MAKFNIEVELDWLDYEENIDDVLKEEVITNIQNKLTERIEKQTTEKIAEKLTEKVDASVDEFLKNITTERIEQIEIPVKEDSWSSEVEMVPISEFIGRKFDSMMTEEKLDGRGKKYDRYNSREHGGPYSITEYLTRNYIAKELNEKVIDMIQQAKTQAEQTLIKSLEENLQQQLNADMLQRLNVPELFKQLQNTITIQGDNNES